MPLEWKGRSGLVLVVLAAGVLALGLLIATSSAAVAGSGSGSSGSSVSAAGFALTGNYKPPSFVGYVVRGGSAWSR